MSDYIKYMYREYLEGRTRIKKVNEDQPLFPNTGAGLLIQKNKLTDDWTALNVSDGHYEEESFNHEALAAAFLQGANMGQLRMLNEILDRARLNGPYCLENLVADNAVDNSQLELADFDRAFPTVDISHDESMPRRYLMFDLDSASLKKEFGPTRYTLAYSDLREALENRGFEHRQGSGYLSKAPISKNKLIVLYDSLVEELPVY